MVACQFEIYVAMYARLDNTDWDYENKNGNLATRFFLRVTLQENLGLYQLRWSEAVACQFKSYVACTTQSI